MYLEWLYGKEKKNDSEQLQQRSHQLYFNSSGNYFDPGDRLI
jgi:hypothetical protein